MILGCTEICIVFNGEKSGFRTFNSLEILADTIIKEYENLKRYDGYLENLNKF